MVHKPCVNESRTGFRLAGQDVYFALGHVKNVSNSAGCVEKYQPYLGMEDFYNRCRVEVGTEGKERKPTSKVVESLIYAGAFDKFGTREEMMKEYYRLAGKIESGKCSKSSAENKKYVIPCADLDYGGTLELGEIQAVYKKGLKKDLVEKEVCFESVRKLDPVNSDIKYVDLPDLSKNALIEQETEMLGIYLSDNLMVKYRDKIITEDIHGITRAKLETEKVRIRILGRITQIQDRNFKNGSNGLRVFVTDGVRDMDFLVFSSAINDFKNQYEVGDVAMIPLKNMGAGCDDPTFRFFDDKPTGKILERGGVAVE